MFKACLPVTASGLELVRVVGEVGSDTDPVADCGGTWRRGEDAASAPRRAQDIVNTARAHRRAQADAVATTGAVATHTGATATATHTGAVATTSAGQAHYGAAGEAGPRQSCS